MSDEKEAKKLTCKDCNAPFEFTKEEEDFLRETFGDKYKAPVRCLACRKLKKQNRRD